LALIASVVIPAFNAAGTIVRAVKSAFEQSVVPFEVVVGCDGCTDDTAALARGAGATALELPKANGSVARNAAVRASSGDVVFFLDADDWWQPGKTESHLSVWSRHSPSFVIDRSTPVQPDGERAHWMGGLDREGDADWTEFLSYRAWASGSSFSVSRENYDAVGGFAERLNKFQDVDFWVRCAHELGAAYTLSASYTNYSVSEAPSVSKVTSQVEENLSRLFEGWPFASPEQLATFSSHAYLTVAEVTPWPKSVDLFKKAHWPVSKPFFWKSLYQSLRRSA
jgi:glycosyltransferase involved in cell wall biosynthesis